jgi:hypothetical protein
MEPNVNWAIARNVTLHSPLRNGGSATVAANDPRKRAVLQAKLAAYDRIARDSPRATVKNDGHAEFSEHLRRVTGPVSVKQALDEQLAMHDAAAAQRAQSRLHQWTQAVYEPIQAKVAQAVDATYAQRMDIRRNAHEAFLQASASRAGVFLDDKTAPGTYDAFAVTRAGLRLPATAEAAADPLLRLITKKLEEDAMVDSRREVIRHARAKEMLPATMWSEQAMACTPHGHLQRSPLGGAKAAAAARSAASHVLMDDFTPASAQERHPVTGRVLAVDREFHRGIRVYADKLKARTARVVAHTSANVYGPRDEFTDAELVDTFVAQATMRGVPYGGVSLRAGQASPQVGPIAGQPGAPQGSNGAAQK